MSFLRKLQEAGKGASDSVEDDSFDSAAIGLAVFFSVVVVLVAGYFSFKIYKNASDQEFSGGIKKRMERPEAPLSERKQHAYLIETAVDQETADDLRLAGAQDDILHRPISPQAAAAQGLRPALPSAVDNHSDEGPSRFGTRVSFSEEPKAPVRAESPVVAVPRPESTAVAPTKVQEPPQQQSDAATAKPPQNFAGGMKQFMKAHQTREQDPQQPSSASKAAKPKGNALTVDVTQGLPDSKDKEPRTPGPTPKAPKTDNVYEAGRPLKEWISAATTAQEEMLAQFDEEAHRDGVVKKNDQALSVASHHAAKASIVEAERAEARDQRDALAVVAQAEAFSGPADRCGAAAREEADLAEAMKRSVIVQSYGDEDVQEAIQMSTALLSPEDQELEEALRRSAAVQHHDDHEFEEALRRSALVQRREDEELEEVLRLSTAGHGSSSSRPHGSSSSMYRGQGG